MDKTSGASQQSYWDHSVFLFLLFSTFLSYSLSQLSLPENKDMFYMFYIYNLIETN